MGRIKEVTSYATQTEEGQKESMKTLMYLVGAYTTGGLAQIIICRIITTALAKTAATVAVSVGSTALRTALTAGGWGLGYIQL